MVESDVIGLPHDGSPASGPREPAWTAGSESALTAEEEAVWRAFARAFIAVPRALDADMVRAEGMSLGTYLVLMHLSETPGRRLRMSELARCTSLSPSRMSRLVDELVGRGWVERERSDTDLRSHYAVLTPSGYDRLAAAYPTHLVSVRRNVIDHLAGLDLVPLASAVQAFADGIRLGPDEVGSDCVDDVDAARGACDDSFGEVAVAGGRARVAGELTPDSVGGD